MTEISIWVADDGKQFDNEEDCIIYEDKTNFSSLNGACACFDSEMNLVDPLDDLNPVDVVRLDTQEAVDWWLNYNNRIGYGTDGIGAPGTYVYSSNEYLWHNAEERIQFYQNLIEKTKKS